MIQTRIEGDLSSVLSSQQILLGQGSFGKVYQTTYKDIQCVVKVIPRQLINKYALNRHIQRQIYLLEKLKHKNVIKLLHWEKDHDNYRLYLQKCDLNLAELLIQNSQKLSKKVRLSIALQLINAIAYLRKQMVAHRDLKPHNIMIKKNGEFHEVKVIDFGHAREIMNNPVSMCHIGNYGYMAPEVFERKQQYNIDCDVWSLGFILYQLFSHPHPNPNQSRKKNLIWPFNEQIDPSSRESINKFYKQSIYQSLSLSKNKIPQIFRKLIREMLQPDPKLRIQFLKLCSLIRENAAQILEYWPIDNEEKQSVQVDLYQPQIWEKQAKQIYRQEAQIVDNFRKLYENLFIPLTDAHQKNKKTEKAKIFICKIFQIIRIQLEQLKNCFNWRNQHIETIVNFSSFQNHQSYVQQLKNYLIRHQVFIEETELQYQQLLAFVRLNCQQHYPRMAEIIRQFFS